MFTGQYTITRSIQCKLDLPLTNLNSSVHRRGNCTVPGSYLFFQIKYDIILAYVNVLSCLNVYNIFCKVVPSVREDMLIIRP